MSLVYVLMDGPNVVGVRPQLAAAKRLADIDGAEASIDGKPVAWNDWYEADRSHYGARVWKRHSLPLNRIGFEQKVEEHQDWAP